MHVRLVAVGKLRDKNVAGLCAELQKRLRPYHRLEIEEIPAGRGPDPATVATAEGERILRITRDERFWLLDRSGTEIASDELSRRIRRLETEGRRGLLLVIAGTFGASPRVLDRAEFVWSLSQLTILHEWARAIVLEQLYRAAKIARGEPYHH